MDVITPDTVVVVGNEIELFLKVIIPAVQVEGVVEAPVLLIAQ
jgi:hypothetical protein